MLTKMMNAVFGCGTPATVFNHHARDARRAVLAGSARARVYVVLPGLCREFSYDWQGNEGCRIPTEETCSILW